MWRAYKYLYYRLYSWNRKMWGDVATTKIYAVLVISTMVFFNLLTIIFTLQAFTHIPYLISQAPKISLAIVIGISILNYFLLMHKDKFQIIEDEFKDESQKVRRKGTLWIIIYFLASFGVFGLSVYLLAIFK